MQTQPLKKPLALFLVGEPGVGKTTLVRALIAAHATNPTFVAEKVPYLTNQGKPTNPEVRWTTVGNLVFAGHYKGDTFDGADRCHREVRLHVSDWETRFATPGSVTLFDGDRFSGEEAKPRIGARASVRVVHLTAPAAVTAERLARRSAKPRADIQQKRAKAANFAATFAPEERLDLDGTEPTETLLAKLLAWLPDIEVADEAPPAPRLPEASNPAVPVGEASGEASPQAPLDHALSILINPGEPAEAAPSPAPAETPSADEPRGAGEPREPTVAPPRPSDVKPDPKPPEAPEGTISWKVQRLAALLVAHAAPLGIYRQGDRIVEIAEIDGQPRPYALTAAQLGLRIEWANKLAGNQCPVELRDANEDEANVSDDQAAVFVLSHHLTTYGGRVLALHVWRDPNTKRQMRVLRGIAYAEPGQALGYDVKTGYYYTRDTATEEVEGATLRLFKVLASIGCFSAKMLIDETCENWASPRKTAAHLRAYRDNNAIDALGSLPCAAYTNKADLQQKTVSEVIDLLVEKERSTDTGVQGQVGAVLRGLHANRRFATAYDHEGSKVAVYELVWDGKSHQLATNPTTWHVAVRPPEPTAPEGGSDRSESAASPETETPPEAPAVDVEIASLAVDVEVASPNRTEPPEVRHEKDGLAWRETRRGTGVVRVDLTGDGVLRAEHMSALEGRFVDDASYALLLGDESVDVYKPDGTLLLAFRKGVFPSSLTRPARRALRRAAQPSKNRGAAAGIATAEGLRRDPAKVIVRGMTASYVTADGYESNTNESNQVLSGILGYFNATPRNPYCRQTAFSEERFRRLGLYATPLIEAIDREFAATTPDRHRAQRQFIEDNRLREKGWILGETAFSTITVNRNYRTAVHRDAGDYAPGFGNLTVLEGRRHRYEGGYLVFPRFRVAVDVRAGDFLAMDVHEWHGNTELRSAAEGEDDWERVSVVCYVREAIAKCGTADEENAKYERWLATEYRTPTERHAENVAQSAPAPDEANRAEDRAVLAPALSPAQAATTSRRGAALTYDPVAWPAFVEFAKEQLRSGDLDPSYPVLRHVYEADGVPAAIAVWRTLLYLAVYDLGSAERLWALMPEPGPLPRIDAPLRFGRSRRGMRVGDHLRQHIDSILDASEGAPETWLRRVAESGDEEGWRAVRTAAEGLRHNGPYFSYKVADLLAHVHGFAITADSIGSKPGRGPFAGMMLLTGLGSTECTVARQRHLLDDARDAGVLFAGLDQLETALCAFSALARGDHYCGADIDQLQETLSEMDPKWWAARRASFPAEYLGEDHGRSGVQTQLCTKYSRSGEVVRSDGRVIWRRT